MASSSNNGPSSAGSSGNSGVMTPSSSTDTASYASAAGSNNTVLSDQPWEPSYQLQAYLTQSPTTDGSVYGRFANQSQTADLQGRIAFYTARAQRATDRYDNQARLREP